MHTISQHAYLLALSLLLFLCLFLFFVVIIWLGPQCLMNTTNPTKLTNEEIEESKKDSQTHTTLKQNKTPSLRDFLSSPLRSLFSLSFFSVFNLFEFQINIPQLISLDSYGQSCSVSIYLFAIIQHIRSGFVPIILARLGQPMHFSSSRSLLLLWKAYQILYLRIQHRVADEEIDSNL